MTGIMLAVCTSATMVAAFGSSTTSHWAPTVCAQVPTLLTTTPSHNHLKARRRNGARADVLAGDSPVTVMTAGRP
jgi:hypothetical protein